MFPDIGETSDWEKIHCNLGIDSEFSRNDPPSYGADSAGSAESFSRGGFDRAAPSGQDDAGARHFHGRTEPVSRFGMPVGPGENGGSRAVSRPDQGGGW